MMKYEQLGHTNIEVSKISVGCMSFGDPEAHTTHRNL